MEIPDNILSLSKAQNPAIPERRRVTMAKAIKCRDVGVDCDFEARANTVEELMKKIAEHAQSAHGMKEIPADLVAKVGAAIRDV